MYGRLILITASPGDRPRMEAVADAFRPLYERQAGFTGVTFFAEEQAGVYGSLSLWESRAAAETAAAALGPRLQDSLAGVQLRGEPQARTVEIYEPTG